MAISEEEVRKSFARVKDDILQLKRSINKQAFASEETGRSLSDFLQKDEFYAFIKRLGSKIEELENQFPLKSDTDDIEGLASEIREKISSLRKAVERKDELAEEIRQVRKLQGKVLELEGLSVPKPEFSKEVARLKADLSSLKSETSARSSELSSSASSLTGSLAKLTKDLTEFGARLNSLVTKAVVKDDISSFTERIELSSQEMSRGVSSLKRDVDKKVSFVSSFEEKLSSLGEKLASAENAIAAINESLSRKFVDKHGFEKALADLRSKLNETTQLIESSMSEANLDDYVTKRSLKQQLSSVSDSVPAAVDSALSSKLSSVEEQLHSLKSQLDSLQKDAGKRHAKDVSKLSEEIERFSSELAQFGDFASKLDRLQRSSEDTWNDAKKEIKRQRELFEERLRSLESYYRSSNESLKAELDELRSQIKSLSKADAAAKVEMAKISTSAAKVAAKTASELIEEAEEEAKEVREVWRGGRGKGLSPFAVSVIIVALLIFGSVSYVLFKNAVTQPEKLQPVQPVQPELKENITLPPAAPQAAELPAEPAEEKPEAITQPEEAVNVSVNVSTENVSAENISAFANVSAEANVSNVSQPAPEGNVSMNASVGERIADIIEDKNAACKKELECTKRSGSEYWFDCYFDNATMDCRCFVGSINKCPQLLIENESMAGETVEGEKEGEKGKAPGPRYYGFMAFVVLVVLFFAYRTLFVKEEKHEKEAEGQKEKEPKESRTEKTAQKQEKEKEKPLKAASKEDEDVIDLEEFFEKK